MPCIHQITQHRGPPTIASAGAPPRTTAMHPRRSYPFLNHPLLIILLPIITLTLLFFAVPYFLSATSHIIQSTSVRKSWDSLNIFLVVFAILCGVFVRRNEDEFTPSDEETIATTIHRNVAYRKMTEEEEGYVSQNWFGFSEERKLYDPSQLQSPATGFNRLRRSSTSYPDLRRWQTGDDRYKFRFFDDFEIHKFHSTAVDDQVPAAVDHCKQWTEAEEDVDVKEIPVDTLEIHSSPPVPELPPKTPPPPPPPPPVASRRKPRRTYQAVPHMEKGDNGSEVTKLNDDEISIIRSQPAPPPLPSVKMRSERRKRNVKREIAIIWDSVLSNQKERKKKRRTKSNHNHHYDNIDELPNNTIAPKQPTPPPPPPPPPQLPPSVFHNLFRKGLGKSKKINSVSTPPPPPPPPPLTPSRRWSWRKSQIPPPPPPPSQRATPSTPPLELHRRKTAGRPPLPTKVISFNEEAINNGNQSPLIPIPVPPPPPPFKMPAMKFIVRGDFVKIRSNQSSRCSSPEREEIEVAESTTVNAVTVNGEAGGSVFCPSPDVNMKAATFIARLRGEWKLEKLNSLKEKANEGPLGHYH